MIFLQLLVWLSYAFYLVFGSVCLASGLYLVAEFVEEHTAITKKAIRYAIMAVFVLRLLLGVFEAFSLWISLLGLGALVLYYRLLQKKFPFIEFTNPMFLSASGISLLEHFLWFRFFNNSQAVSFSQAVAYLSICVWLVPFAFFVSLSSSDMLPGIQMTDGSTFGAAERPGEQDVLLGPKRGGSRAVNRLLALFNFLRKKRQEILPSSVFNLKAM